MKIISQIDEDTFVISLKDDEKAKGCRIITAHDYVGIITNIYPHTDSDLCKHVTGKHALCNNVVVMKSMMQVPIRSMAQVVLPYLSSSEYFQPAHLADRVYTEDDTYYQRMGMETPRYLKGDTYPSYSVMNEIVEYWEGNNLMVAVKMAGESKFNHVTHKFFEEYIKPNLK